MATRQAKQLNTQQTRHGTARIRGLAAELKLLREKAEMTTRDASSVVGMSAASLNRLENGGKAIGPEDVSALLVAYSVTGTERERLMSLAREADMPGWWETGNGALPKQLPALITFETEAIRIVDTATLLVPGLLQTADYARAVLTSAGVLGQDMETMLATRLGRQAVLGNPRAPHYLAILDEAVLRRPVGSPHVMADQLTHIIDSATHPNVDLRVVPFARGAHTGLDGSYMSLEFRAAWPIVYLEHKRSTMFVDDPHDVAAFHTATDVLLATALGPADSIEFLGTVAGDFKRG